MSYQFLANGPTQFAVDWAIVSRIVRSYHTARLQMVHAREVTPSNSHWYNPMTWSLPAISHVEVDWEKVRVDADALAQTDVRNMRIEAKYNTARIARRVEDLIELTAERKETFVNWLRTVQRQNLAAIRNAIADYECGVEVEQFVRDTSSGGLMIGASVLTGPAAVAALGDAPFLRGTCQFHDTGMVGAGIIRGAGTLGFALVRLGKPSSVKPDMVLALVQAPYAAGTELVGGASVSRAVASSALRLTAPASRLFQVGPAKTLLGKALLDKVAVPITVTYGGEHVASSFLRSLEQRRELADAETGPITLSETPAGESPMDTSPRPQGQIIDQATVSTKFLLDLAFVNVEKGIGQGW